jgi:hypothetical protein
MMLGNAGKCLNKIWQKECAVAHLLEGKMANKWVLVIELFKLES